MADSTGSSRPGSTDGRPRRQASPAAGAASSGLSAGAADAAAGELIASARDPWGSVPRRLGRQFGQRPFDLAPDLAERNPEDSLTALEKIDHLIGRGALIHADAVAHQRHLGQVVSTAIAQVLDGRPDLLQGNPGVEQPLDDLQHQDVTEAVQAL